MHGILTGVSTEVVSNDGLASDASTAELDVSRDGAGFRGAVFSRGLGGMGFEWVLTEGEGARVVDGVA